MTMAKPLHPAAWPRWRGAAACLAFLFIFLTILPASMATAAAANNAANAFSVDGATRTYLQKISPQAKARSDAYFEGGYWVQLWSYLYGAVVGISLLQTRLSARMRDRAVRASRFKPVQSVLYALQYLVLVGIAMLPWSWYTDFFREHQYGLSTQNFSGWLRDWAVGLVVNVIVGAIAIVVLFAIARRLAATWHVWGGIASVLLLTLLIIVSPVFIAPLFNKYTLLQDHKVLTPILRLAHANGIAADRVYQVDASRQSTRVSANVSGFLGTMRITLNDNLLNRCSLPEIEAVMGHEMGHYVLNHSYKLVMMFGIVILVGFVFLRRSSEHLLARLGESWQVKEVRDLAVIPLIVVLFSTYLFLLTPVTNTITRTQEQEADMFGLNASRQPDGFAEVALKLSDYRKMEPGPVEEWIFFDHPSGATRIRNAMRWKAENLPMTGAPAPPDTK
jgi:STE24 endopeptidase